MPLTPRPRLRISRDFRSAVKADPRGLTALALSTGWSCYTNLSRAIHRPVADTVKTRARLAELALRIAFTGEIYVPRKERG